MNTQDQIKKERNRAKAALWRLRHPDRIKAMSVKYYTAIRAKYLAEQRSKSERLYKTCVMCGSDFITNHKTKKTDTKECSIQLQKMRAQQSKKETIKNTKKSKTCVFCGNKFFAIGFGKTCSERCSRERKIMRIRDYRRDYLRRPETVKRIRKWYHDWYYNPVNIDMIREKGREYNRKFGGVSPSTQKFFLSLKLGKSVNKTQNMKTPTEVIKVPTAPEIVQAFDRLMKETKAVCGLLAIACDANPLIFDEIIELDSRFNYNMLESMRKVGKSELYEELLFDPSHNARRLLSFPPRQQEEIYTKPIKIVKQVGGKNIVEEKPFQKLSKHECALVLDESKKRVRTVEEQIGFIKTPAPLRSERYEINGDKLIVLAKTEFTMSALEDILNRMKSKEIQNLTTKK